MIYLLLDSFKWTMIYVKWFVALLYIWIIATLWRAQLKNGPLRSSFYFLYLLHLCTDLVNFFFVELLYRPAMADYLFAFNEGQKGLAEFTYFGIVALPSVVALDHVIIAANRYTVFKYPTRYGKIWSTRVVLLSWCSIWVVAGVVVIPFWLESRKDIAFVENEGVQIYGGGLFEVKLYTYLATAVVVCVCCIYFYGYAVLHTDQKKSMDIRLLSCAALSSLPMLFELARYVILYLSISLQINFLFGFAGDLWFYIDAFNFLLQVAAPLYLNTSLRQATFHTSKPSNSSVSTVAHTSFKTRTTTL